MTSSAGSPPAPLFILQNSKPVTALLFSTSNSDLFYTGNREGDFTVYTLALRRILFSANPHKQAILSIVELDEATVLTHARNGSIFKWSKTSNNSYEYECVYESEAHTFCPISFDEQSGRLFLPSKQTSLIECIDTRHFEPVSTFKFSTDTSKLGLVMNMKAIDDNYLLAGYESGELVLFDARGFGEVSRLGLFEGQPLMCLDYSKTKNFGCCGSTENEMNQFRIEGCLSRAGKAIELTNPGVNCLKIRQSDSKVMATGGWDNRVRLFGTKKQKGLAVLCFHKSAVNAIDFSASNLMAAGSSDGVVSFWDLYAGN